MGNLLTFNRTFQWDDSTIDRGEAIKNLNAAILKSKEYDELFKTIDFDKIETSWGNLMEFVFEYGWDETVRHQRFPWMTQLQHTTLVYILSSFKNTTALNSSNLISLSAEFPGENCGHIGFKQNDIEDEYVSCENTLKSFHTKYVMTFNRNERLENKKYFYDFHQPNYELDINPINQLIRKGGLNALIVRIDKESYDPQGNLLHGERIQVHFNDRNKCALNIDGTWKHHSFNLPNDVCDKLIEWGFILPENLEKI